MRKEVLETLSAEELEGYAAVIGVDVSNVKTKKARIAKIVEARERTADINALGMTLTVPIKKLHDKRVTDRLNGGIVGDEELMEIMAAILGEDQLAKIEAHCTDDDGTVDVDAYGVILAAVVNSDELKNF